MTDDVTWECHETHYKLFKEEEHDVGIVENVPEYEEGHAMRNLDRKKWGCESVVLDPRLFGQGASRTRRYIVVWKKATVVKLPGMSISEVINALKQVPSLKAEDYFWMDTNGAPLTSSQETNV